MVMILLLIIDNGIKYTRSVLVVNQINYLLLNWLMATQIQVSWQLDISINFHEFPFNYGAQTLYRIFQCGVFYLSLIRAIIIISYSL